MPEAKNTFLKAKMNQDLDDRLLPNGEYRTAQNVLVGKSEEDSVGTLQNIRGNQILDNLTRPANSFIIGYLMDATGNRIFAFFTDNANEHSIRVHTIGNSSDWTTLVEGAFLNFSTTYPILNVNLLEDLLFWTDNNNQPRKINVTRSSGYYTKEHQISVAKYNPYLPISLVKQEIEEVVGVPTTTVFDVAENVNIVPGMVVVSKSGPASVITGGDFITVDSVSTAASITTVTLSSAASSITAGDIMYFLSSTMTDESGDAQWPGDPSYLESRFVRFGYRFKFDDNEYSIFSPFTQIAFIPKQKGYFLNGQEQLAVNSTILEWFENSVNNVDLIIPLPDKANNILNSYKIKEIDILYKESDQIPIKVVDTITEFSSSNNYYTYNYQSRKPIRTLPEAQTVRVYDKVPPKALTQEVVSNRVIYGNFLTKLTPPRQINYTVNVTEKNTSGGYENFVEYPNHTLKQNRNYQVGFVLSDKYGRQSDVILSPVSATSDNKGSTIFAPYIPDDPEGSGTPDANYYNDLRKWFGNSLFLNLLTPITGSQTTDLYATENGDGFDVDPAGAVAITDTTYTFDLLSGGHSDVPETGDYMRGEYIDYVEVESVDSSSAPTYIVTTSGRVNDIYLKNTEIVSPITDAKFAYTLDVNGWYSYKIVVKQTEQEYYNVYLPSAINATDFPTAKTTDTATTVSYITLINDNINKVPRDLAEVGPDQKQYRSSVRLFGRVQPTYAAGPIFGNQQYFPLRTADTSTAVGNTEDILGNATAAPNAEDAVFQYDSNPIVARISTNKEFGIDATDFSGNNRFSLAVYETEPVVSALDIYWETSQTGLISDLNAEVLTGFNGPVAMEGVTDLLEENLASGQPATTYFSPITSDGNPLPAGYTVSLASVFDTNGAGANAASKFTLVPEPGNTGAYRIETTTGFVFTNTSDTVDEYLFTLTVADTASTWLTANISFTLKLTNTTPSFDAQGAPPNQEYYYFFEDSTTTFEIRNFLTQNNTLNGSADTGGNQSQLKFDLSGTDASLFELDEDTGILTPSTAGVAAGLNTYEITVTLTDANRGTGSIAVSQDYLIVKGYEPSNNGNTIGQANWSAFFSWNQSSPTTYNQHYLAWYMADSTLAESDLPGLGFVSSYSSLTASSTINRQTPVKVANTVTQGGFIFGIEESDIVNFNLGSANGNVYADIGVEAYYREAGSSSWNLASDLNNTNSLGIDYGYDISSTNNERGYAFFAQERNQYSSSATGIEFAFIAIATGQDNSNPPITGPYGDSIGMSGNIVIRDLHYTGASQSQQVYQYKIYEGGGASTAAGATKTGATEYIYADNPLAENVEKFFTGTQVLPGTTNFATIYTPPSTLYYIIELEWGPASSSGPPGGLTHDRNGKINDPSGGGGVVSRFATTVKIDSTTGLIDRSLTPTVAISDGYLSSFKSRATTTTDQTNTYFDTL